MTHLVAGGSTGGTITGTGRYLREMNPNTEVVLPDPVGSVFYDFWMNGVDEKELKTSSYQVALLCCHQQRLRSVLQPVVIACTQSIHGTVS